MSTASTSVSRPLPSESRSRMPSEAQCVSPGLRRWAACHAMNVQDVYSATILANSLGYPQTIAEDSLVKRNLANPMEGFGVP